MESSSSCEWALGEWLRLELDIVETARASLEKLEGPAAAACAEAIRREHAENAHRLARLVEWLGGPPATAVRAHPVTKERASVRQSTCDAEILEVLRASSAARAAAFTAALARKMPPIMRPLIERALVVEKRHVASLERCARALTPSSSSRAA